MNPLLVQAIGFVGVALFVLLGALTVMTVFTWAGWKSLLPFASVAITNTGYWTQNAQETS